MFENFDALLEGALTGNESQRRVKTAELSHQLEAEIDRALVMKSSGETRARLDELASMVDRLEAGRKGASERIADVRSFMDAGSAMDDGSPYSMGAGLEKVRQKAVQPFFPKDACEELWKAAKGRGGCEIEIKTPTFADMGTDLPPTLFPQIIGAVHEGRILDHLPTSSTSTPQVEYIQALSWTGSAATVAPGAQKPQIVFDITTQLATVSKIACYASASRELTLDYETFWNFMNNELTKILFDEENSQLISGNGTGANITGFFSTSGILTREVIDSGEIGEQLPLDTILAAIADMRVGSSLAVCDLLVLHPQTWNMLLSLKDQYGRYYITPDPTKAAVDSLWGIPIVQTTVMPTGQALMLDTTKAGRVWIRDGLTMIVDGYSQATSNLINVIVEERLTLAVERPTAVEQVTGLVAP